MTRLKLVCILISIVLCLGCGVLRQGVLDQELSESEALILAVTLANVECTKEFGNSPFDEKSYKISFLDGRWVWGSLDLSGIHGYSAVVSFDPIGADRDVEIFYSLDAGGIDAIYR
jgi:hypothetical protein